MADLKISELGAIAAVASADVLAIVDTSLSETNKVSVEDLLRSAPAGTAAAPSIAFVDDPDTGFYRSGANELSISTAGSQRVVVDDAGNVGIGTSNPSRTFHVINNDGAGIVARVESTGNRARVAFKDTNTTTDAYVGIGSAGDDILLYAGSSEKMRIDSAGNMGVGTSSPNRLLHVSGDGNLMFEVQSTGTTATGRIGGTSVGTLHLGVDGNNAITGNSTANRLSFATAGSEKVRIDSAGNVGIGTSSPGEKLEVNGTIKATDINFTGLATYADDTAAGTGGLVAGDVYKTSTGELRIKL